MTRVCVTYLERFPDQSLVLVGQGSDVATRVQATRDGTLERHDATFIMAYISASQSVTVNTAVIPSRTLSAYWFNPESGLSELIQDSVENPGSLTLEKRANGQDWVVVIEDAAKNYPRPK